MAHATITCHGPRADGQCAIGLVGLNGCFCYRDGLAKPNYPVPTTIVANWNTTLVEILPHSVLMWTRDKVGYKLHDLSK